MADKRRKWNRNLCAEREKAENIKEKRTAKTEPKTEEIVIPIQRKLWRLLKPLLTYELFLIGATVLLALILMTFTTGGYLEERMHATSVLASAIGSLAAIPVLWKQYKKDEGMFPKPENGGVRQRQPPVFCWL